jgi:lariat debranching enzyme
MITKVRNTPTLSPDDHEEAQHTHLPPRPFEIPLSHVKGHMSVGDPGPAGSGPYSEDVGPLNEDGGPRAPPYLVVVGDVHGSHDAMTDRLAVVTARLGRPPGIMIQVGDFEPHRNEKDLAGMACPKKYRRLGDFPRYCSGERNFPAEVLFVGGNHEPYGWLDLHPGGFSLTDRCTYLGRAGVVERLGFRIAGLSGIYSRRHFTDPRPDPELIDSTRNKLYTYMREGDTASLMCAGSTRPPDILVTHEWPSGMVTAGELRARGFDLGRDGPNVTIGAGPVRHLIDNLRPRHHFCGHMHFPYSSTIVHDDGSTTKVHCLAKLSTRPGDKSIEVFGTRGTQLLPMGGEW